MLHWTTQHSNTGVYIHTDIGFEPASPLFEWYGRSLLLPTSLCRKVQNNGTEPVTEGGSSV